MSIDPRIPAPIQPILHDYLSFTEESLNGLISGFYLAGSIALVEFNEQFSDIDLVATLSRRVTDQEMNALVKSTP